MPQHLLEPEDWPEILAKLQKIVHDIQVAGPRKMRKGQDPLVTNRSLEVTLDEPSMKLLISGNNEGLLALVKSILCAVDPDSVIGSHCDWDETTLSDCNVSLTIRRSTD